MRYYEKGRCLRRAGFADWRVSLLRMMIPDPDVLAVAELRLDPDIETELERLRRFMQERGRSRATYYRIKGKLSR